MKKREIWIFKKINNFGKRFFAFQILIFFAFSLANLSNLSASERLPLTVYSSADGLASSVIHHIARDSQGFLWFCARGGLSRFDGYEFTSYRFTEDQTSVLVHYFLETRDGTFWISTDNGLYRVKPQAKTEILPSNETFRKGERKLDAVKVANYSFFTLYEDKKGRLWGGSDVLYLIENLEAENVSVKKLQFQESIQNRPFIVSDITETEDGSLWIANSFSLVRLLPDGRFINYEVPPIATRDESYAVKKDSSGKIWFAHITGVFVFHPEPLESLSNLPNQAVINLPAEEIKLDITGTISFPTDSKKMLRIVPKDYKNSAENKSNKFGSPLVEDLYISTDGKIWLPTQQSLYSFEDGKYQSLRDSTGLSFISKQVAEDLQGNLWLGTFGGAIKYKRNGLISYNEIGGLPNPVIHLISETPDKEILAFHGNWQISRWTNEGFQSVQLNMPESARFSWTSFPVFQDKSGAIWVLTLKGLFRYPPTTKFADLSNAIPQNISFPGIISKEKPMYRAFSDKQGNIFFSSRGGSGKNDDNGLYKYNLQTGEWQDFSKIEGYPQGYSISSFAEDKAGNIWFGFYGRDGLFKYANERFKEFTTEDGLPNASIFALKIDKIGRLWIGSSGDGLARVDNPSAEKLEFIRYNENNGLSSNNVRCLAEDTDGNIYAGTVRGVSQINPENGQIRQITTTDGLAADFVHAAFRAADGAMWFGTANGLSKFIPSKEIKSAISQVFISDLQIAGTNYALSEFGQTEVGNIEVGASENNLQINFSSVGEREKIKYQYKLEGAAQSDWSEAGNNRSVNFANLAPGSYQFLVRAVNDAGQISKSEAFVNFKIRPPVWQTWWFLILSAFVVCLILYLIYQYRTKNLLKINAALTEANRLEENLRKSREERLAELQKVRTRIATDLHDDIGASLTQIAVLSEVARRNVLEAKEISVQPLESISTVSNELVETMADIVWAINPRKDTLRELVLRMRRFASDVLSSRDIEFELEAPETEDKIQLGANIRREVFSIYKECINNIVRHSGAKNVLIDFELRDEKIFVRIADDGRGFDTESILSEDFSPDKGGNGLINMRRRAKDLGGDCVIESSEKGTVIELQIPFSAAFENNGTTAYMDSDTNGKHV